MAFEARLGVALGLGSAAAVAPAVEPLGAVALGGGLLGALAPSLDRVGAVASTLAVAGAGAVVALGFADMPVSALGIGALRGDGGAGIAVESPAAGTRAFLRDLVESPDVFFSARSTRDPASVPGVADRNGPTRRAWLARCCAACVCRGRGSSIVRDCHGATAAAWGAEPSAASKKAPLSASTQTTRSGVSIVAWWLLLGLGSVRGWVRSWTLPARCLPCRVPSSWLLPVAAALWASVRPVRTVSVRSLPALGDGTG